MRFIGQRLGAALEVAKAKFRDDEAGLSALEYGLMGGLVAGVIIIAVTALGLNLSNAFQGLADKIPQP